MVAFHHSVAADAVVDGEPSIEVSEIFDEGELEEGGPWCVDDGTSIAVMSTRQICDATRAGTLSPQLKAWRDGQACWLPIFEHPELFQGYETPSPVVVDLVDESPVEEPRVQPAGGVMAIAGAAFTVAISLMVLGGVVGWTAASHAASTTMRARHLEIDVSRYQAARW